METVQSLVYETNLPWMTSGPVIGEVAWKISEMTHKHFLILLMQHNLFIHANLFNKQMLH
jgi:hypothetical protein